jgi:hypothetical protein
MKVFIVSHLQPTDGRWSGRLIGVYSSQATAARAIERLSRDPQFREYARGFQVDAMELDEDFRQAVYYMSPPPPPHGSSPSPWN